jgi:predicted double-glycine peptidase
MDEASIPKEPAHFLYSVCGHIALQVVLSYADGKLVLEGKVVTEGFNMKTSTVSLV